MTTNSRRAGPFSPWRIGTWTLTVVVAAVMILPTIVIVVLSFSSGSAIIFPPPGYSLRWYVNLATSEVWLMGVRDSLLVGAMAMVLAIALGTPAAIGIARSRSRLKLLYTVVLLAPLILPMVVVAVGTYLVFLKWKLTGGYIGMIVAHATLGLPYVVINVLASYRAMDHSLELAAQSLGADPLRTFVHVVFPSILPGVVAGALFAFITSWDEVIVALFLSSPQTRTLPVVMWSQLRSSVDPTIAAAASTLTAITTAFLLGFVSLRRGKGLLNVVEQKRA